jgi:hypothetical protein
MKMKKLIINTTIIVFSIVLAAHAEKFAEINGLPFRDVSKLIGATDLKGNVLIFYLTNEKANFALFNSDGEQINTIDFQARSNYEVETIFNTPDEFCIIYTYMIAYEILRYQLKINKTDGSVSDNSRISDVSADSEEFINNITLYNGAIYCNVNKKLNQLSLRIFDGDQTPKIVSINTKMPYLFDHFRKHEPVLIKTSNLIALPEQNPNLRSQLSFSKKSEVSSKYQGHMKNKVFLKDSLLYFLYDGYDFQKDGKNSYTEILKINIANSNHDYKLFVKAKSQPGEETNAYILDDYLLKVGLSKKNFALSIYDLNSLTLIKEHNIGLTDEFFLKDGPLKQSGEKLDELAYDLDSKDNKIIFKILKRGIPSIMAYNSDQETISLKIGCYKAPSTATVGGGGFTPGSTISTPYGTVSTPGTWNYSPIRSSNIGNGTFIYFETALDTKNFDKTSFTGGKVNYLEKTIEKINASDMKIGMMTAFTNGNNSFVAYVDKKEKVIIIDKVGSLIKF